MKIPHLTILAIFAMLGSERTSTALIGDNDALFENHPLIRFVQQFEGSGGGPSRRGCHPRGGGRYHCMRNQRGRIKCYCWVWAWRPDVAAKLL